MSEATATDKHEEIRRWVEERNGRPARVKATSNGGLLRIDFGEPEESLEPISWEEFFRVFDENRLLFLHQDKTADGSLSRFNKFIDRR
ncbi:hypothetical protein [Sinorhizobium alkalisoli]|uniref:Uncharacterized protein n=1 Tax=Sinorhizobium alkalisoli TaxID=1752398 RepID=A0A1E3VF57_9HYPH|nr:hypothetical protein [Sinorhizobium alkalisoli]MCG5480617.1 hypothetical protein [Sinorhizobium alkalisoli]ODR92208.1 hypothetical protein A8M32_06050 [Sinorhizobium alkalisoli]QFI69943.1 1,4-alpha-glucan branching enzyme [Sinorhizobium alkalisoli]